MKGPALIFGKKTIPLMADMKNVTFNEEKGIYFNSEVFDTEIFYINEKTRQIAIYDRKSGILEMKIENIPDFAKELMDIYDVYRRK